MKHAEGTRMYKADDGKMIVRVADGKVVGDDLWLGVNDNIANYREDAFTEEQRAQFFKGIGMEDLKKKASKKRNSKERRA